MDTHIYIADTTSLRETVGHIIFLFAVVAYCLLPLAMYLRFRRMIRNGNHVKPEFVKAARRKVLWKMAPLIVTGISALVAAILMLFTDPRFHEVDIDKNGMALDYSDFGKADVYLEWTAVEDIELHKADPDYLWHLIIYTVDGEEYQSGLSSSYRANDEVRSAFKTLKRAWKQSNESHSPRSNDSK